MNFQEIKQELMLGKQAKNKKNYNATEIKNQRITRRMKKIMKNNTLLSNRQVDQKCAICLSECGKNSATLPCYHAFCIGCISNWWMNNSTCPYCRQYFQYVFDYKGRKLQRDQLPKQLLIKRQQTLKCQSCWADIGNEPMRICFQCRCVYIHKRCLLGQQIKSRVWRCEECWQQEEQEYQKSLEKKQKQKDIYKCSRINMQSLNHRHSQRLSINYKN